MKKILGILKEILLELSVIPVFFAFLAIVLLIGLLLPDSFMRNLPFEVLIILAIVSVLAVLYAASGIIAIFQKIRCKKTNPNRDEK